MATLTFKAPIKISSQQLFMLSVLLVNGGNYFYNLILGRVLGPKAFADAAVLITFLLVVSFLAMTFQLATAKFITTVKNEESFTSKMFKNSFITGLFFGFLIVFFAKELQVLFQTTSSTMFVVFGVGVPIYFLMSVNRGIFQGNSAFKGLSITYQTEMLSRLFITLLLLYFFNLSAPIIISIGIIISFFFGLIPINVKKLTIFKSVRLAKIEQKQLRNFFIVTAFYELSQIIINNSDILLVKHYFTALDAGLYASLALIGRVVYFIAWMFVMLLLPAVIQLKKEKKSTAPILFKYVGYIGTIAALIVVSCLMFPELIISLLFGKAYIAIAPLLWKYALATGIFAISNIFAYYFLSLDKYIPVVFSGVFGLLQIGGIIVFHETIAEVVHVQILVMVLLFITQITFFIFDEFQHKKNKSKSSYHSS